MTQELVQVVFWLVVAAVVIVAYEMHAALKPTYCEHCAHCAALRELERDKEAELKTYQYGSKTPPNWHDSEDDGPDER